MSEDKSEDKPEEPSAYSPTTIEKVFELLDNKLITFGIPGALSFVGITKASGHRHPGVLREPPGFGLQSKSGVVNCSTSQS